MKTSAAIQAWLKKPNDYTSGLMLYHQIKISTKHDKFLAGIHPIGSMQHNFLKSALTKALTKLRSNPNLDHNIIIPGYPDDNSQKQVKPVDSPSKPQVWDNPMLKKQTSPKPDPQLLQKIVNVDPQHTVRFIDKDVSMLPADLQKAHKEIKIMHRDLATAHHNLKNAKTDAERSVFYDKCVKINGRIRDNWDAIDTYVKAHAGNNNKSTTLDKDSEISVTHIIKQIQSKERNLARYKADLSKPNIKQTKKDTLKAKILACENEITSLQKRLTVK